MTTVSSEADVNRDAVEITYDDHAEHLAYHGRELVDQLRDEAVGGFGLPEAPDRFLLCRADGKRLAGELTLSEAGVKAGDRLLLLLKVVSVIYNGREERFVYRGHELVGTLRDEALRRFGVTVNAHLMGLFDAANAELADAETLRMASVEPGSTLVLRQSVVRGG
jgi:hypothetical protein